MEDDDWGAGDEDLSGARAFLLYDRKKVRGSLGRRQSRSLQVSSLEEPTPSFDHRPSFDPWCVPDDERERPRAVQELGAWSFDHASSSCSDWKSSASRPASQALNRADVSAPLIRAPLIVHPGAEGCEAVVQNPELLPSSRAGRACGSTAIAVEDPDEWRSETLLRHDQRKLVTGTICLQVQYKDADMPGEDVFSLHEGGCGRIFVEELRTCGQAFRSGVRPGDELVLVRVGLRGVPQTPQGVSCLSTLADSFGEAERRANKGHPVTLFFMGFAGKFPAEVRVTAQPEERCGILGVQELVGTAGFGVYEEVVLRPRSAPLLLVAAESAGMDRQKSVATDGSEDGFPADANRRSRLGAKSDRAGKDSEAQQHAPGVLELEQAAAQKLLRRAVLDLSVHGHPDVGAWARSRPLSSVVPEAEDTEPGSAWDDLLNVLIGRPGEAAPSTLSSVCSGEPDQSTSFTLVFSCSGPPSPRPISDPGQPQVWRQAMVQEPGAPVSRGGAQEPAHRQPNAVAAQQASKGDAPVHSSVGDMSPPVSLAGEVTVSLGERLDSSASSRNTMASPLMSSGDAADLELAHDRPKVPSPSSADKVVICPPSDRSPERSAGKDPAPAPPVAPEAGVVTPSHLVPEQKLETIVA